MFSKILFILFFTFHLKSECTDGVLKCNIQTNLPEICDYSKFFKLDVPNGKCKQNIIEDCLIASFDDSPCIKCIKGKILDPQEGKCVTIPTSKIKENCIEYDLTGNSCIQCLDSFWVSNGLCVALEESAMISNCSHYQSATECAICQNGYRLADNICTSFTKIEGCFKHTDRLCTGCESNYFLSENSTIFETLNHAFFTQFLTITDTISQWSTEANSSSSCILKTVTNCLEFENFDACKICETGYFVNSQKNCETNPLQPIAFCSIYLNETTCVQCDNTHYLSNNGCLPVTEIDNCHTYAVDGDKCLICNPGYYGNSLGSLCTLRSLPAISQCSELNSTADECATCDPKYSLTLDNKKCLRDIDNCQTQVQGADLSFESHFCTACHSEYYLLGNNKCLASNIPNCSSHLSNENKCDICNDGNYPDNGGAECVPQSSPHCLSFTTNTNECSDCEADYYITASDTCELKQISGCVQLSSGNENTCDKCENLKYLMVSNKICGPISNTLNCNTSDGINNACLECKAGFYFNSTNCSNTRTSAQYDENCDANIVSVLSTQCERCKAGFSLLTPTQPSTTFANMASLNCSSIDSTTGNCNQCIETFELTSSFACQLNANHSTLACAQLTVDTVGTLTTNTNCAKCRNDISHYLEGGICKVRTHISANSDCEIINETTDTACLACSEDKLPVIPEIYKARSIPQCSLTSSLSFTPNISRCHIYFSNGTCSTCIHGYVWDNSSNSCIGSNNSVSVVGDVIFDKNLRIIGMNDLTHTSVSGCNKYAQAGIKTIICIACNSGYVPAIDEPLTGDTDNMDFSTIRIDNSNNVNFDDIAMPSIQYCIAQASQFRIGVNTNHVPNGSCLWGIKKSGYSEYACQKCIHGKKGVLYDITHRSNNTLVSSSFRAVGGCTQNITSDFVDYMNLDYEIRLVPHRVRWSSYFEMTSCTGGKYLVIHAVTSIKDPFITFSEYDYTNPSASMPVQDCISSVFIDSNLVNNCSIYALHEDFSSNIDYSNLQAMTNFKCIACDPGYASVLDSEGEYIDSCNLISHCDQTPSNNTWLGSCETPSNNAWEIEEVEIKDEEMEFVAYHKPVSSTDAISNCIIVDVGRVECRMCNFGYILSNGACVSVNSQISNCNRVSIGEAFLELSETSLSPYQFSNFMLIRVPTSNTYSMDYNIINCVTCNSNYTLVMSTTSPAEVFPLKENGDENDTICKTALIHQPTRGDPPEGCLYPKFDDSTKCYQCQLGYTLNITDYTCVNHTIHLHCVTLETLSNAVVCKECAKSHYLDDAKNCQHRRCKLFTTSSSTDCALCQSNYIPDPHNSDRCLLNPDRATDFCDGYSPSLDHCVVCDDLTKIPFLYFLNNVLKKVECNPFPSSILDQYGVKEMFMEIKYDSTYTATVPELKYLSSEDSTPRIYTQVPSLGFPHDQHCFEHPVIPNCNTDGVSNGGVCFKCDSGFYLSDFNECTEVIIHDCQEFTLRAPTCEVCADSHYLASNKTICSNRVNSQNCLGKSPNSDTCTSCDYTSEYLDSDNLCKSFSASGCNQKSQNANVCLSCQTGLWAEDVVGGVACHNHTAEHCETYANNKDECVSCKTGFWKGESNGKVICNDFTAIHCQTYETEKDECLTCDESHWKNVINSKVLCENYTALRCEEYKTDNDECHVCQQGFFKNNLTCDQVTNVDKCTEYSTTANACVKCIFGSFLDSGLNKCISNPDGIKFCDVYQTRQICLECQTGYYPSDTKCLEVTTAIDNCQVYSADNTCSKCGTGKFLKENACVDIVATGCLTYESELKCSTCPDNFILNEESGNCEESGIQNCLIAIKGSPNTCQQCLPGFLTSADSTSCTSPDVPIVHCADYLTLTECKFCESNYLLSSDRKTCSALDNKAGQNCSKGSFVTTSICDVCHLGYKKTKDSLCTPYDDQYCLYRKGNEEECQICKSGSYMDEVGRCVGPVDEPDNIINENETSLIFKIWLFTVVLLIQ